VVIVGVGLIGGSIGQAVRALGLAERVVGMGRDRERLGEAQRLGAIDEATTDPARAFESAEVAVICTPVDRIVEDARSAVRLGPEGMLVTDAGSTKRKIVEALEADDDARLKFVGAHPIAGSERSGAPHARADLFAGRACVITSTTRTAEDRLARCRAFWGALGCRLVEMSPDAHDRALALSSHLPHVVSSALAATIPLKALPLAAGAYRDATRVAAADAGLWSAIFRVNREPVVSAIEEFQSHLVELKQAILADDDQAIRALWESGKRRRAHFEET
jgi:prephenate dehydrogenase